MLMFIKKTFSKEKKNRDKVTSFMIHITDQFKSELEESDSIKDTLRSLNDFIYTLQTLVNMEEKN